MCCSALYVYMSWMGIQSSIFLILSSFFSALRLIRFDNRKNIKIPNINRHRSQGPNALSIKSSKEENSKLPRFLFFSKSFTFVFDSLAKLWTFHNDCCCAVFVCAHVALCILFALFAVSMFFRSNFTSWNFKRRHQYNIGELFFSWFVCLYSFGFFSIFNSFDPLYSTTFKWWFQLLKSLTIFSNRWFLLSSMTESFQML